MSDFEMDNLHIDCLGDFVEDGRNLDLEAFEEMHGQAFFLHDGPLDKLREPPKAPRTLSVESESPADEADPRENFLVFPVRRRVEVRGPDDALIRLGRSDKNDVVIPDGSVSSFHAILIRDKGAFLLFDQGSRNGSFINEQPAPVEGSEPGAPLAPGTRVRLGTVNLTFLPVAEFHRLLNGLAV